MRAGGRDGGARPPALSLQHATGGYAVHCLAYRVSNNLRLPAFLTHPVQCFRLIRGWATRFAAMLSQSFEIRSDRMRFAHH